MIYRSLEEILHQAELNVLILKHINSKPIVSHSEEIKPVRCNKPTVKDKYLKKVRNRHKVKRK